MTLSDGCSTSVLRACCSPVTAHLAAAHGSCAVRNQHNASKVPCHNIALNTSATKSLRQPDAMSWMPYAALVLVLAVGLAAFAVTVWAVPWAQQRGIGGGPAVTSVLLLAAAMATTLSGSILLPSAQQEAAKQARPRCLLIVTHHCASFAYFVPAWCVKHCRCRWRS